MSLHQPMLRLPAKTAWINGACKHVPKLVGLRESELSRLETATLRPGVEHEMWGYRTCARIDSSTLKFGIAAKDRPLLERGKYGAALRQGTHSPDQFFRVEDICRHAAREGPGDAYLPGYAVPASLWELPSGRVLSWNSGIKVLIAHGPQKRHRTSWKDPKPCQSSGTPLADISLRAHMQA